MKIRKFKKDNQKNKILLGIILGIFLIVGSIAFLKPMLSMKRRKVLMC